VINKHNIFANSKLRISLDYDNQPVEGATDLDYVFHSGFGWEW